MSAPLGPDDPLLGAGVAERLARLSLLAQRLPEARRRGQRRTRRIGHGTDAIDERAYEPGDDPRRIDWSAFARFERLLVRVVADEAPLRLGLLLDTSASMGFGTMDTPTKLTQACRVAAGLAAVAAGAEDRVALTCAGPGPSLRVAGGARGLGRLLGALAPLTASGPTRLAAAARGMRGLLGGRGLVVVLSDLWDPDGALAAADALRGAGHEVVLARVLSSFERRPDGIDGLTLEDAETGELVTLPPSGALERYLAAFAAHEAALAEGARALGALLLPIDAAEPFDAVVLRALERGVLSRRSAAGC
ncbi:MAG: DUF58 domain-containing protein [Sandaracinaceae bacterium]|nr:DUF58 domain-containing protein [Sandaracinaceae bacterium]